MPPLDDLELILHKNLKMHEASFGTAHAYIYDDEEDSSACSEPLGRDGGENDNQGIHQIMTVQPNSW